MIIQGYYKDIKDITKMYIIDISLNIIIGIITGITLAFLVYNIVPQDIMRGPASNDIKQKIFIKDKTECYRLKPEIYICPIEYSMKLNKIK